MKTCSSGEFNRSLAAGTIGNNEDLLTEILLHVPAKSLIRFKSVSKRWLSLISDSRFSMNHTRKNPKPPISGLLLAYYYYNKWEAIPLQNQKSLPNLNFIDRISSDVSVWGGCNGLILCSENINSLFVCNPITQKYIKLPKPVVWGVSCSYKFEIQTANLAFDSSESPHYKVLFTHGVIDRELGGNSYEVYIYSSESTSWEKMSIDRRRGQFFFGKNKVYWNRAFHWIYNKTHYRFDLKNKKLTETPNPLGPQGFRNIQIIYNGNCGGRYFLLQTNNENLLMCDVLEMKKDDYNWNLKCTVDFSLIKCVVFKSNDYGPLNKLVSVLCVSEGNERDDLELVIATRDDRVSRYNINSNKTEVLQHSPNLFRKLFYHTVFTHQLIESMSPV